MIRLYDKELDQEVPNNVDLNEILELMENIDESYKQRKEIPAEYITTHINTLFYSILYILDVEEEGAIETLKDCIKFWEKFSNGQQKILLDKFTKQIENTNLINDDIRKWVYSLTNIQKRYL